MSRISLSDYDNPNVRYNRMDSDAPWELDGDIVNGVEGVEIDEREQVLGFLLRERNKGNISEGELDKIRDLLSL